MLASAGPPGRPLPNIPIRICELLLSITDRAGFGQDVHEANYNDAIDGCLGALHILWYFCLFFYFFLYIVILVDVNMREMKLPSGDPVNIRLGL